MTTIIPPDIDLRHQDELVEQIRNLLNLYVPGSKESSLVDDPQINTLVNIFSRLMEINIQKLNKALDKNYIAFLDLLGISLLPPRPARTALTFSLAKGSTRHVFVKKGTQVAAEESPDDKPVVFETDSDRTIILPQLVKAISLIPENDSYADHSATFFGEESGQLEPLFKGAQLTPHRLYIGDSQSFVFEQAKNLRLKIGIDSDNAETADDELANILTKVRKRTSAQISSQISDGEHLVQWYRFDADTNQPVPLQIDSKSKSSVVNLQESGEITFINLNNIAEKEIIGFHSKSETKSTWTNHWIFAELKASVRGQSFLKIPAITTRVEQPEAEQTETLSLQADHAFFDNFEIDLTKDFYPFGKRPVFNSTFYLASSEAFQYEGAKINIKVTLSEGIPKPNTKNITLLWEYYDGKQWAALSRTDQDGEHANTFNFKDYTHAFIVDVQDPSTTVEFDCPAIEPRKIYGVESYWIRVRIVDGNYGKEASYQEKREYYLKEEFFGNLSTLQSGAETLTPDQITALQALTGTGFASEDALLLKLANVCDSSSVESKLKSEVIKEAKLYIETQALSEYEYTPDTFAPPSIQNLIISYETTIFVEPECILTYNDFLYTEHKNLGIEKPFIPFTPIPDEYSALYLAFDQSVANLPVTLFFPLVTEGLISPLQENQAKLPVLSWEYWSGEKWSSLMVVDNTKELMCREMIQFLPPKNLTSRVCFGERHYWIRAVLFEGTYPIKILSTSIYSNAVWAYNRITANKVILGSSTGGPNQVVSIPHYPVLAGQKLLVRETSLTSDEIKMIETEEGKDAIEEIKDSTGNVTAYWIRWHQVPHFHGSASNSRHYIIDHNTGKLYFGNGINGLIPQTGKDNLKFEQYQYGGGERGNTAARTITKLLSSIPYLDKVTNPLPAEGGVNAENKDQVKNRGSRALRTRNRAITAKDYEWIVLEATPKAARAKCLPVMNPSKQFKPGWVTIIVVPDSQENKPMPAEELMEEVRNYLYDRSAVNLVNRQQSTINLIPPNYIKIDVKIETIINSINEAKQIELRVDRRVKQFLHPISGGPGGTGWEFGRDVHIAEIYESIEKIDGVNAVETISLTAQIQIFELTLDKPFCSTFSLPEQSRVYFNYEKIVFSLAESIPTKTDIHSFKIVGFMEGDMVEIYNMVEDDSGNLIRSSERLQLSITSVSVSESEEQKTAILSCVPVISEYNFPERSFLDTYLKPPERKIQSFILKPVKIGERVSEIHIALPEMGSEYVIRHRDWPSTKISGRLQSYQCNFDHVFLPEDYLVYAGEIEVTTKLSPVLQSKQTSIDHSKAEGAGFESEERTEKAKYVLNKRSGEIHDLMNETANCNIKKMNPENKQFIYSLEEIEKIMKSRKIDLCAHCFKLMDD